MRCCKVHLSGTENMRPLQFRSPSMAHIYMRFLWNILHLYGWWQLYWPLFWRDLDGFEIIPTSKYRSLPQPSWRFGEVSPIPASWLSSLSIARCLACQAKTQQNMPLGGGTWGQYNTKDLRKWDITRSNKTTIWLHILDEILNTIIPSFMKRQTYTWHLLSLASPKSLH